MQNIKGTYDYFGKEQSLRKKIQSTLQDLFELYDFESIDTTLLNELALLTSKYAGGDEILKEMYQLTDQGNRALGLRYDLTIPFAKVIALNPGIELPFKRYEIGKVFRDGPVKRGRLREFLQCDVDVVGISGPEAEAELMQLATEAFNKLGIPILLKWNNRRFLSEILESIGVSSEDQLSVILTLDKLEKISINGVHNELISKGLESATIAAIRELIEMNNPSFEHLCYKYDLIEQPGALEVLTLQKLIQDIGLQQTCHFDPFLSRGLSFYTGTVYEIFDASGSFTSSLGAGGRYDAIIGQLVDREDLQYPAVGLSFGMESMMALLAERTPQEINTATVMVIPIGETLPQALITAAELRACSIRTTIVSGTQKLKKQLKAASSKNIRYVILIGESESSGNQVRLKDMQEQTEVIVPLDKAIYLITG